jgi:large subunit ribosomal protein L14e
MVVLELGRVCMKLAGREAGKYCVVVKAAGKSKDEKSYVTVTGPRLLTGIKRRRSNIDHLKATEYKLEVKENATDEEVVSAYEKAGVIGKLGLKKPSAADMKAAAERKEQKAAKKAEAKKAEAKKAEAKKSAKKSEKKGGKKAKKK